MFKKSSIAAIQQQLTQLETLRYDQLNGLLKQLERQKAKIRIEDHAILNWGIGVVRAKMQDEEQFMREIDDKWERLKQKYSPNAYEEFIQISGWKSLNLSEDGDQKHLYESGWSNLRNILSLCIEEGRIRVDFKSVVNNFKEILRRFCNEKGSEGLFKKIINQYLDGCNKNNSEELSEYYKELGKILEKN